MKISGRSSVVVNNGDVCNFRKSDVSEGSVAKVDYVVARQHRNHKRSKWRVEVRLVLGIECIRDSYVVIRVSSRRAADLDVPGVICFEGCKLKDV